MIGSDNFAVAGNGNHDRVAVIGNHNCANATGNHIHILGNNKTKP